MIDRTGGRNTNRGQEEVVENEAPNPTSPVVRVLLIEDDPDVSALLQEMIKGAKDPTFDLESAQRLSAGLNRLTEGGIDVVLLDLGLPDSEGIETFLEVKRKAPTVPVVVLTGLDDQDLAVKAVREGAQDYLVKTDIKGRRLVQSIRYAVERQRPLARLEKKVENLRRRTDELRKTNRHILEEQELVLKEEKLTVLLQMAGAIAHELNTPISVMMGFVDLMKGHKDVPEELTEYLAYILETSEELANIVSRIQNIRHYETVPYCGDVSIINIHQKAKVLLVLNSDSEAEAILPVLKELDNVEWTQAGGVEEALQAVDQIRFDLVIVSGSVAPGAVFDRIEENEEGESKTPMIVIGGAESEAADFRPAHNRTRDYLPLAFVNSRSLSLSIAKALEKARLQRELERIQSRMTELSSPSLSPIQRSGP
jgi:two-component system cell cycle response regulator